MTKNRVYSVEVPCSLSHSRTRKVQDVRRLPILSQYTNFYLMSSSTDYLRRVPTVDSERGAEGKPAKLIQIWRLWSLSSKSICPTHDHLDKTAHCDEEKRHRSSRKWTTLELFSLVSQNSLLWLSNKTSQSNETIKHFPHWNKQRLGHLFQTFNHLLHSSFSRLWTWRLWWLRGSYQLPMISCLVEERRIIIIEAIKDFEQSLLFTFQSILMRKQQESRRQESFRAS